MSEVFYQSDENRWMEIQKTLNGTMGSLHVSDVNR